MPFRYRLEAILKLQRSIEKQEENRLLACAAKVVALRNEMNAWENERKNRKCLAAEELKTGSTGAAMNLTAEWDSTVRQKQRELGKLLLQAEEVRRAQLAKVQQERQKREVLQGLKDRLEGAYDQEELRKVQQVMDDLFLTRVSYYQG